MLPSKIFAINIGFILKYECGGIHLTAILGMEIYHENV